MSSVGQSCSVKVTDIGAPVYSTVIFHGPAQRTYEKDQGPEKRCESLPTEWGRGGSVRFKVGAWLLGVAYLHSGFAVVQGGDQILLWDKQKNLPGVLLPHFNATVGNRGISRKHTLICYTEIRKTLLLLEKRQENIQAQDPALIQSRRVLPLEWTGSSLPSKTLDHHVAEFECNKARGGEGLQGYWERQT